ncbi:ATP-binding cassette domain-containing protein [Liquorilactobacillus satsumensis]|uniref:methionine ABC transporter ATP-binding protein n=1 Tax=Liquorilactobacillus satsumensis TaxID=259059 RepID=UPI0021C40C18|nr:ATP-binding cassette domain-containing protein [Liquorilactobacillus satsumensis]MCP9311911.1 ATP-binding cassette domain-containing protein [Liquorilactobacillus satsumensis]MCP9359044.1 ATP-binding cassette domain-containing protein [Liquorilactobacillus satsumensis]
MTGKNMIALQDISVQFKQRNESIQAVQHVDLTIAKGDIYGIIGYSGAGKSTLVRVINLLQKPSSGKVIFGTQDLGQLDAAGLRKARRKIGMIFQHFNLMKSRTVLGNVEYPLLGLKITKEARQQKALKLLELVGLKEYAATYPKQLSGGQKQRVAIARALANDPEVLISDEATSALDPKTTKSILALLRQVNQKLGITIVLITHEMQVISSICHNVAVMDAGKIIERGPVTKISARPQQKLTADFVETATNVKEALTRILKQNSVSERKLLIYLKFIGNTAQESIISSISRDFNLDINILFANIDQIDGVNIGYLIADFIGARSVILTVTEKLKAAGIAVKILDNAEGQVQL